METKFFSLSELDNYKPKMETYIFGGGDFATGLYETLNNHGISINGFCIDDGYWKEGMQLKNVPILPLSKITEKDDNIYDLFYAVALPSRLKSFLKQQSPKKIYMLFNSFEQWEYDEEFFEKNSDRLNETRELLVDTLSKKTLDDYLYAKRTGDGTADIENCIDSTYYNDVTNVVRNMEGALVDCGAYIGDSVDEFFSFIGNNRVPVFAFEPDVNNYNVIREHFKNLPNVHCTPCGTWDSDTTLRFSATGNEESHLVEDGEQIDKENTIEVRVKTIDDVLNGEKASFIKMDVEGSELRSLKGAKRTIQRDLPVLAISAYHKIEDLVELPQYINEISNGRYKFYLRHHGCVCPEFVLYAIP